jgi:hypothetical protein
MKTPPDISMSPLGEQISAKAAALQLIVNFPRAVIRITDRRRLV